MSKAIVLLILFLVHGSMKDRERKAPPVQMKKLRICYYIWSCIAAFRGIADVWCDGNLMIDMISDSANVYYILH